MKVLISSLEDENFTKEYEVEELNYNPEKADFWMPLVIGDDWFQRVTSTFSFAPEVVRFSGRVCFVVFSKNDECEKLMGWLEYAKARVKEGYRTMRG